MADHSPMSKVFALPLRLGSGTRNEAPIFDHNGELIGECVDDDCDERALAFIRATNCFDSMLAALKAAEDLYLMAPPKAFANGVTDSTGSMDEGEYHAGAIADQIRAAIAKAEG